MKLFNQSRHFFTCGIVVILSALNVNHSYANNNTNTLSLQNLERERAALIQDILDPSLDVSQRLQKINKRQRQLTDMERMVMRDERLLNGQSRLVKKAFDTYDKTFLVHAGAENNRSAKQQWFATIKLSNDAVLNTRLAYRK